MNDCNSESYMMHAGDEILTPDQEAEMADRGYDSLPGAAEDRRTSEAAAARLEAFIESKTNTGSRGWDSDPENEVDPREPFIGAGQDDDFKPFERMGCTDDWEGEDEDGEIDSRDIAVTLLQNDGVYPGDPQIYALSSYRNMEGGLAFHMAMKGEFELAEASSSPYVSDLTLLWKRGQGLTPNGRLFLSAMKKEVVEELKALALETSKPLLPPVPKRTTRGNEKAFISQEAFERRMNLIELINTYNESSNPCVARTDAEHRVARARAKTALASIKRNYIEGVDYKELSTGALWPREVGI